MVSDCCRTEKPPACRCRYFGGQSHKWLFLVCLTFLAAFANAQFTLGTGRVANIAPIGTPPGCVALTQEGVSEFWDIQEKRDYRITLTGAPSVVPTRLRYCCIILSSVLEILPPFKPLQPALLQGSTKSISTSATTVRPCMCGIAPRTITRQRVS